MLGKRKRKRKRLRKNYRKMSPQEKPAEKKKKQEDVRNQNQDGRSRFRFTPVPIIDLDSSDEDVELQRVFFPSIDDLEIIDVKQKGILRQTATLTSTPSGFDPYYRSKHERGESSVMSIMESCVICKDSKPPALLLRSINCGHHFCEDCVKKHLAEKLQESIYAHKCPESNCNAFLGRAFCRALLPERFVEHWMDAFNESSVLAQPMLLQCPFETCSDFFVDDEKGYLVRACPNCWKIFCLRCRVPWHLGMTCGEFQDRLREQKLQELRLIWPQELSRLSAPIHFIIFP